MKELPPWILILGIAGRSVIPAERVQFQVKDIKEIAQQFDLQLLSEIPGARGNEMLEVLLNHSKEQEPYWKMRYQGKCRDIFFLTTLDKTTEFVNTMFSIAESHHYPVSDVDVYIQPIHQGASCHVEFNLPFNPADQLNAVKIEKLYVDASEALFNEGAFYSRPYGIWANMAYKKDPKTTTVLRKIKGIFDPNNVMNPGKLCF
jgi:FAD/FMN-containing dehydrogenase